MLAKNQQTHNESWYVSFRKLFFFFFFFLNFCLFRFFFVFWIFFFKCFSFKCFPVCNFPNDNGTFLLYAIYFSTMFSTHSFSMFIMFVNRTFSTKDCTTNEEIHWQSSIYIYVCYVSYGYCGWRKFVWLKRISYSVWIAT